MTFANCYEDDARAEAYATLEFKNTYHLAYRDIPAILGAHVRGRKAAVISAVSDNRYYVKLRKQAYNSRLGRRKRQNSRAASKKSISAPPGSAFDVHDPTASRQWLECLRRCRGLFLVLAYFNVFAFRKNAEDML